MNVRMQRKETLIKQSDVCVIHAVSLSTRLQLLRDALHY